MKTRKGAPGAVRDEHTNGSHQKSLAFACSLR